MGNWAKWYALEHGFSKQRSLMSSYPSLSRKTSSHKEHFMFVRYYELSYDRFLQAKFRIFSYLSLSSFGPELSYPSPSRKTLQSPFLTKSNHVCNVLWTVLWHIFACNIQEFFLIHPYPDLVREALPLFFLCIFSSLTCLTCFQQAGSSAVEGTSQDIPGSSADRKGLAGLSLFLKSEKNPSSALRRKRTWVQALPSFSTCFLGLSAWGTDLKSRKAGPSPIHKVLTESFFYKEHSCLWGTTNFLRDRWN